MWFQRGLVLGLGLFNISVSVLDPGIENFLIKFTDDTNSL